MLNIVIFGAPGAGKGTQSELIVKKYGLHHISTGEILRHEIENRTPSGVIAQEFIDQGHLVPDQLIIDILAETLDKYPQSKGYVFDGFPRTLSQGKELDAMLNGKGTVIAAVFSLSVEEKDLIFRLLKRGEFSGRTDDNMEVIKERLTVYKEQTEPLKEYYKKKGKLFDIKGYSTIEDIFERITEVIDLLAFKK
ncbi:MAG: adenylate kinase [Dysgonamonadaceae bacterium]|jgi:adenylate kinase|nr:adenylate kinase [Dysgonamonadaceae bacterium]